MRENFVLGAIQGIAEWLPVSSEGLIVLAQVNLFHKTGLEQLISQALFLHLGTFLAALIYFRRDIVKLLVFKKDQSIQKLFQFLLIATLISGALGLILLKTIAHFESQLLVSGKIITLLIGLLLLITGWLQLKSPPRGLRQRKALVLKDAVVLGLVQGLAVLPGFSRSGLTVSALLLRKFEKAEALKLSFLLSLPIVFLGNIVLNASQLHWSSSSLLQLSSSFFFGMITIDILLRLARKVNFGFFVIGFALLTIAFAFFL